MKLQVKTGITNWLDLYTPNPRFWLPGESEKGCSKEGYRE